MSRSAARRNPQRRRSTIQLFIYNANSKIKEQFMQDERFHPTVIGVILLLFLFSVSAFVSHMEGLSYFDSFYACFVTYSSIGFGDLDIFVSNSLSKCFNILTKTWLISRGFHTDLDGFTCYSMEIWFTLWVTWSLLLG